MGYLKKLLAFLFVLAATSAAAQSVPPLISYQGRLMDSGGLPITGASVPMTFSLWDGETGGTFLWSEPQAVEVSGGLYSVLLGDSVPLPASVFSGATVYLEVTVMAETLAPRERLTSVAYAFRAEDADSLGGLAASAYSLVGHTHSFAGLTGTATDAQIPDNITNRPGRERGPAQRPARQRLCPGRGRHRDRGPPGERQAHGAREPQGGQRPVRHERTDRTRRRASAGYGILNSLGSPPATGRICTDRWEE